VDCKALWAHDPALGRPNPERRSGRTRRVSAASDGGAEHWATIASLIETCELNDVEAGGPVQPFMEVPDRPTHSIAMLPARSSGAS